MRTTPHRHPRFLRSLTSTIVALLVLALPAWSQHHDHGGEGTYRQGDALGKVGFPVSCAPDSERELERGVALLHHMMYVESREVFEALADDDPACAMAHWGIAMTLFQPLWPTRPSLEDLERGWREVQRAKERGTRTERESAFVAAAESFFAEPAASDYWARIHRYERAMEAVYRAHPRDREARAFYSLALLSTAAQADNPGEQHAAAAKILLGIYEEEPTHPGAIHYTIHANDIDSRASERLDVVRSYDDIAPSVPHALHMPTHVFVRLGAWDDVIHWNEKSAAAALDFPAGDKVSHHYIHALDYLIYAHLQQGNDAAAQEVLERARQQGGYQPTFISAFHLASMPARFAVERRDWAQAAKLRTRSPADLPWDEFPWPEAITELARGLGAARTGDLAGAGTALDRLEELEAAARDAGEAYFVTQMQIARLTVAAWIDFDQGRTDEAVRLMEEATTLEASVQKHPVTPGALQPAPELLGDLYMELGLPDRAAEAYHASLAAWPRRFHSLLGAARAAAAGGDRQQAADLYRQFLELTADRTTRRDEMREARGYIDS